MAAVSMTAPVPARRLVIRPLTHPTVLPADFEDAAWSQLEAAVRAIQLSRPPGRPLEALYGLVEDLCRHGFGARLYERLERELRVHAERVVSELSVKATLPAREFLDLLVEAWEVYRAGLSLLRQVFLQLDRRRGRWAGGGGWQSEAPRTARPDPSGALPRVGGGGGVGPAAPLPTYELGLELLRSSLEASPEASARGVRGMLDAVAADRAADSNHPDAACLRAAVAIHAGLGTYRRDVEPGLLAEAESYYEAFAADGLGTPGAGSDEAGDGVPRAATTPRSAAVAAAAAAAAARGPVSSYLAAVEAALSEEDARARGSLPASTRGPLLEVARGRLLGGARAGEVLARCLDPMLHAASGDAPGSEEDLARLFRLLSDVDALEQLRLAFRGHIKAVGAALVGAEARDADLVPTLLDWKASLDRVVRVCFAASPPFAAALREGFESVMNVRGNRPAELLARHLDGLLRGGVAAPPGGVDLADSAAARAAAARRAAVHDAAPPAAPGGSSPGTTSPRQSAPGATSPQQAAPAARPTPLSEPELEAALEASLSLFRFVQGKDAFEVFYKRDLARRLLLGRSAGEDLERGAVARLRAECGPGFTSKLEGMFKDLETSRDLSAAYRAASSAPDAPGPRLDASALVLTQGFWPTFGGAAAAAVVGGGADADAAAASSSSSAPPASDGLHLPPELVRERDQFADFYLAAHGGRRLSWAPSLSSVVVRVRFDQGPKDLTLSLHQALVLLVWDADDAVDEGGAFAPMTAPELARRTGIADAGELRRALVGLACGRERVLRKEPPGREVRDGDTFAFDPSFTSRAHRIRLNSAQLRDSPAEARATVEAVAQDRQHQVDAAIVRVMKAQRRATHRALLRELAASLRFPLAAADLKRRLESLIDREYIERDPNDPDTYTYVA